MVPSLEPTSCPTECPEEIALRMRPIGTHAYPRDDEPGLWAGQTTWAWDEKGVRHAVGWDWVEMQRDVLVLSDPMALVSNIAFPSHEKSELGERRRVLLLNSIVYLLPWQEQVRMGLGRSTSKVSQLSVGPKSARIGGRKEWALAA